MNNQTETVTAGLTRLIYRTEELTWDEGQACLILSPGVALRLDELSHFGHEFRRLAPIQRAGLVELLRSLAVSQQAPEGCWRTVLGKLAFLLLRCSQKQDDGTLRLAAQDVLCWLGPEGEETAWRLSYDETLDVARRYRLVRMAHDGLSRTYQQGRGEDTEFHLPEREFLEARWWTTRCLYELAVHWWLKEGLRNHEARRALSEASMIYLSTLRSEARIHDLERFLEGCATNIEDEVKRIALPPRGLPVLRDEVAGRSLVSWFLRRYDLLTALKLTWRCAAKSSEAVALAFSCLTAAFALGIFYETLTENFSLKRYGLQVGMQGLSLASLVFFAPTFFRLMLPRAMFGSLLAWLTVILSILLSVGGVDIGSDTLQVRMRNFLQNYTKIATLSSVPVLLITLLFVMHEITNCVRSSWNSFLRAIVGLIGFYLGAFFWGVMFAWPIKMLLNAMPAAAGGTSTYDCLDLVPIAVTGSSLAVLFGFLVQLLWEDKTITEPLREPF